MSRIVCYISLLLVFSDAFSQSNTDQMLGAPKVKYFLQLWHDFPNKKFYYTIDDSELPSSKSKTLKGLTVGVPMRFKEIALTIKFYNPLRYTIKTSDSLLADPSYQSIGEFAGALTTLLGNLPNAAPKQSPTVTAGAVPVGNANATVASVHDPFPIYPAGKFDPIMVKTTNDKNLPKASVISADESKNWAKKINALAAEELAEWKFISLQGNVQCIDTTSNLLKLLQQLDDRYFNASIRGVMKAYLLQLSQPDEMEEFGRVNKRFKVVLDSLDKVNQENIRLLQTFNGIISEPISKDLLRKNALSTNDYSCESFATYSQIVFKRFARARAEFQEKRNQMLDLAKKINSEVDGLMKQVVLPGDGSVRLTNAFILSRYDIHTENMRDIRIVVQERKLNLNGSPPSIDKTDNSFEGKLRLRAAQTFVAEFSMGGFYTNMTFPEYSIKYIDGVSKIAKSDERYSVGVAGMLNLTLNAIDGLAHPLIQLGVGSGNKRPVFLAGAGMRLSWKTPIIITAGPIWHWQQVLKNGYKEDSPIADEAVLKENLEYQFVSKPNLYLGIQIGF
ncbi:hypothetical protein [Xanthocytophaga agilis]|uniref:Uncharacterized protein n=1 Tax=Xanthocytophaga agilis TaxID=3048010 RepID=A0AAE3UFS3_9BACT|nr:hypothetical protein [Xanthocytophaga agilis]MDJ1503595.1 hypothetical protein [Xanthocytophaga agilis]